MLSQNKKIKFSYSESSSVFWKLTKEINSFLTYNCSFEVSLTDDKNGFIKSELYKYFFPIFKHELAIE